MDDNPKTFLEWFQEDKSTEPKRKQPPQDLDNPEMFLEKFKLELKPNIECVVPCVKITKEHLVEYAPLCEKNLQRIQLELIRRLLASGPHSFIDLNESIFEGDGVYALYYCGDFKDYLPIQSPGAKIPIYIGKAGRSESDRRGIHSRLREHYHSIGQTNLGLENFVYRFTLLNAHLVELAEKMLIKAYRPIWNEALTGLGRARPGQWGTKVSSFDTKHPGRQFTGEYTPQTTRTMEEVDRELETGIWISLRAYQQTTKLLENQCERRDSNPHALSDKRF